MLQEILDEPVLCLKEQLKHEGCHVTKPFLLSTVCPTLPPCLEREVSEKRDTVARGFIKSVKAYEFFATRDLLSDVLHHLSVLRLVFQKEDVNLSIVQPQVATTISSLKSFSETSQGVSCKAFLTLLRN